MQNSGSRRGGAQQGAEQMSIDVPNWGSDEDDDLAEITRLFERRNESISE